MRRHTYDADHPTRTIRRVKGRRHREENLKIIILNYDVIFQNVTRTNCVEYKDVLFKLLLLLQASLLNSKPFVINYLFRID